MALDPTYDPYSDDPYVQWARAQQQPLQVGAAEYAPALAIPPSPPPPPPPPPVPLPAKDGRTSLGGKRQIAAMGAPTTEETPSGGIALDAPAPAPTNLGEMAPDYVGPAADAVSGAAPAAGVADMADVSTEAPQPASAPPAPGSIDYVDWAKQQAAGQPLPSMQENDSLSSAKAEQDAIAKMSPEEFIQYQGERAGKLRDMQVQRQSEIDAENQRRQQENLRLQQYAYQQAQAKTADLMNQAHALANTKPVVPKASIANAVGIILGGLFSNGGPNMALAQFNRKVDNDIAAQKTQIENQYRGLEMQKTAIGDEYQRSGDLYHAQEVYRVASYEQAIQGMQTELQKYDPAGATAAMIRGGMDQFHAAQAKALEDYNKNQIENGLKQAQTAQALASAYKTQQETAGLAAKQARAGAGTPADNILPRSYFTGLGLMDPGQDMSMAAYEKWLQLKKSSGETVSAGEGATKASRENQADEAATAIHDPTTGKPYTQDGAVVRAASPEIADKVNEETSATQALLDRLSSVRRELASNPSGFDKAAYARIRTNLEDGLRSYAEAHGLKYSSREKEALEGVVGPDYSSFVDRYWSTGKSLASIDQLIDNTMLDAKTKLKSKFGYTGPTGLVDTSKPVASPKTPVDKAEAKIVSQTSKEWTNEDHAIQQMRAAGASPQTAGRILLDYGINVKDPSFQADLERVKNTNVPISKLKLLDQLHEQALHGTDEEKRSASAAIGEIATDEGPTGDMAKSLQELLNVSSALGSPEEVR